MNNNVKLVSLTHPIVDGINTAEEFVAYCARVSNPSNQSNADTAEKLLMYCLRKKHWSVFEMVDLTMEINTTRDIGRQILRHRSFSFQEFSQRYADVSLLDNAFVTRETRMQDPKNRQNSIAIDPQVNVENEFLDRQWQAKQQQIIHENTLAYKWALDHGIAKEQARVVLSEGLTMSRMYMKGSLRSWIHYCMARAPIETGTQKEHREIARDCWFIVTDNFPSLKNLIQL